MDIERVLDECQKTGAWFGVKIKDVNQRNDMNDTPLHTVCSWGELEPVKILVHQGADVNARGDLDSTPIYNAIIGENYEVVEFLLNSGAKTDVKNAINRTPLQCAQNSSAPKNIIKLLSKSKR